MDQHNDIVRDQNGFSYETSVLDGKSITHVRDPQDELFAVVEYTPDPEDYTVAVDGGYPSREDLYSSGLIDQLEIENTRIADFENMIGSFTHEVLDGRKEMTYGLRESEGRIVEVENIEDEEQNVVIRASSTENDIAPLASRLLNRFNPPALTPEPGDSYAEAQRKYGEAPQENSKDREETIEGVLETAVDLTEDILEQKKQRK